MPFYLKGVAPPRIVVGCGFAATQFSNPATNKGRRNRDEWSATREGNCNTLILNGS